MMHIFLVLLFACFVSPSKVIKRDIVEKFSDHFLDLNFFHIYFLQLPNVPNWRAYIRYHIINDSVEAQTIKAKHSLDEGIIIQLANCRELEYAKLKVLNYEIPLKEIKAPKCTLQGVKANRVLILEYISY